MTSESNYTIANATLKVEIKNPHHFSTNDREEKTKTNRTLFARFFSHALSQLQVIAMNSDWFITLFSPVVIGRSSDFAISFSTVTW